MTQVITGIVGLASSRQPPQPQAEPHVQLFQQATVLQEKGELESALAKFSRALELKPGFNEARCNRATVLHELERYQEACDEFERLTDRWPNISEVHCNLAASLLKLNRIEESVTSGRRAIALDSRHPEAHCNLGVALRELERHDEALVAFEQAIELKPNYLYAIYCSGVAMFKLGQYEEALEVFNRTLEIEPEHSDALTYRAIILSNMCRQEEALTAFDQAIAIDSENVSANFNKSLALMSIGNYVAAWPLYEWRKKMRPNNYPQWPYKEAWLGEKALTGKRILVHLEQGMGDFIQNCRYTSQLAAMGGQVILQTTDELLGVAATLADSPTIVSKNDPLPDFDAYIALMSLPLAFNTTLENVPADIPYLYCDKEKQNGWRNILGKRSNKKRIGLAWSGSSNYPGDSKRSIPLESLKEILQLPCEFHVLQKEIRPADQITIDGMPQLKQWCDQLHDFSDTAALIEEMDLLISVDTSVAHLGGALGKPVWLLLSRTPEFRWMREGEHTPWYPSFRIWRQKDDQGWPPVIKAVTAELKQHYIPPSWLNSCMDWAGKLRAWLHKPVS